MTANLDHRNTNALWASVLVETLVRAGVTRAVVSPGSRSTPLAIALARHPAIEALAVLDERSAGFFALGLAKPDLRPVVLVCTSGTAAANYFPAVIEAHESGVPLLVLTADRPPEMRGCASGQTIDQQKLYGAYVNFWHELAGPELDLARLRYLRQTISHAVRRCLAPQPGPVHLNAPFRDPLPPLADGGVAESFAGKIDWRRFFAAGSRPAVAGFAADRLDWPTDVHGLIVAGPAQPEDAGGYAAAVADLARRLGWPVLAEGLSPLRNHAAGVPNLVTTYDAILRAPANAERLRPDLVLAIGGWPTSKVLRSWLEAADPEIWLVAERFDNRDALHGRTRQIATSLAELAGQIPAGSGTDGYARMWSELESAVRAALDHRLESATEIVEPKAAWLLGHHLPAGTPLVIANSMPIRDVEYVWPAGDREIRPFCNRGANGIDGTLSTAVGIAHATGRPTVLLTGDLALLHDTNGFLLRPSTRAALTIVVINNRGGGIFEHLPVAQFEPPFEQFFATPQEVDFSRMAATYGVDHRLIRHWDDFVTAVSELPEKGWRMIELRTDRKHDAALRRRWYGEAGASR